MTTTQQSPDRELLPCPFCGGDDAAIIQSGYGCFTGACMGCQAVGPYGDTREAAAVEWNSRAAAEIGRSMP